MKNLVGKVLGSFQQVQQQIVDIFLVLFRNLLLVGTMGVKLQAIGVPDRQ